MSSIEELLRTDPNCHSPSRCAAHGVLGGRGWRDGEFGNEGFELSRKREEWEVLF